MQLVKLHAPAITPADCCPASETIRALGVFLSSGERLDIDCDSIEPCKVEDSARSP